MALVTFKAVSRKGTGGLAVESESHGFKITMDEPPSMGGTDTGMSPVEGLLVALGSCQVVTAAAFAKFQGMDLKDYWVEVEGDLDPAGFMKGAPGVPVGFQQIRLKVHIKTDAPEDKVEEFQKFVESRCPVDSSLVNGVAGVPADVVLER
ncbi:MAG: OsmC family protein [Candidatus Cryosericum sp.]